MAQIGPQIKSAQNLLRFGTFDISNMPILILMSKMIFIKYLPPASPKFFPKLKMLRIYWNLGTFDISNIPILILMWKIIFIKYLPPVWPKLVPEFIKIWHIRCSKDVDFDVRNVFYEIFTRCHAKLTPRLKLLWNLCLIFWVFQSWLKATTCYARIGLRIWIPISIIKCKLIFMKYT